MLYMRNSCVAPTRRTRCHNCGGLVGNYDTDVSHRKHPGPNFEVRRSFQGKRDGGMYAGTGWL